MPRDNGSVAPVLRHAFDGLRGDAGAIAPAALLVCDPAPGPPAASYTQCDVAFTPSVSILLAIK